MMWVLFFAVLHEAEVRQGAVSLALDVCGRVRQVMAEASLGVSVVMRFADVEVTMLRQKWGLGYVLGRGHQVLEQKNQRPPLSLPFLYDVAEVLPVHLVLSDEQLDFILLCNFLEEYLGLQPFNYVLGRPFKLIDRCELRSRDSENIIKRTVAQSKTLS